MCTGMECTHTAPERGSAGIRKGSFPTKGGETTEYCRHNRGQSSREYLEQCRMVWEAQDGETFDIQFLQKYFGPYLAGFEHEPVTKFPKR